MMQIGVICLYKAQVHSLVDMLSKEDGLEGTAGLLVKLRTLISFFCICDIFDPQVSTVDAFQGGEKEIIIVSCCRTESLGFITSPNRMNVALTRARRHLILVGSGKTLPKNQYWNQIIEQARSAPGGYFNSRDFQMSGHQYELGDGFQLEDDTLSFHADLTNSGMEEPSADEGNSQAPICGSKVSVANDSFDESLCTDYCSPCSINQEELSTVTTAERSAAKCKSSDLNILPSNSAQKKTLLPSFDLDGDDD